MINTRSKNFQYNCYILGVQKSLNDMFLKLKNVETTNSISADFINQFLIYQCTAGKISKTTALCTNFRPVFDVASEISEKRSEILKDVGKIEKFCGNFKNCAVGIRNYKSEFGKICDKYGSILKDIGNCRNINIFFLKFMIRYNNFSVALIQNALKYRICPQIRLISEYCTVIGRKENIVMQGILNSVK